ncbi:MAG: hypothetical protein ACYCUG_04105 [Acidimicrobiales bacterium]
MILDRDTARRLARLNGIARLGLGVVALALPGVPLLPWVGAARKDRSARLLARALGGRDVALGAGTLRAIDGGQQAAGWVAAGGVADAGDVVATLLAWRHLPRLGRLLVLLAAGGGVASAVAVAGAVDVPPPRLV